MSRKIQKQVKLPIQVAFGVVLQGIRIRLGRSLVTISGIVLGVAFLMSIFTSEIIKDAVSEQTALRNEVSRMFGFLAAETGPMLGHDITVLQVGPLDRAERLLVERIVEEKPRAVRWASLDAPTIPLPAGVSAVEANAIGPDALALLVVGGATEPNAVTFDAPAVVAATRSATRDALAGRHGKIVSLERSRREDEIKAAEETRRKDAFRKRWILIISLLVTVIGISNAMLMSVTERFREIGTMKCLGALSGFIRQMFLIESMLMGVVGAASGVIVGVILPAAAYGQTYGYGHAFGALIQLKMLGVMALCMMIGVLLSVAAAIYPANFASRMLPAAALRSKI